MSAIVTTSDIFTMYVFLEVVAVSSFALIAFNCDGRGIEGAIKYLFLSALASALILLGIALVFATTGGTSFGNLETLFANEKVLAFAAAFLFISGFLIKSGLVPFHGWVPDAYESAPGAVSALLSGIITKTAGVYALLRICMVERSAAAGWAARIDESLMFFGAASIIIGALVAVTQSNFKRMLAFSSISQVGYIVLAAGLGTPLAIIGAAFHLFNHAIFKAALFLNQASVERATGSMDMNELGGLESRMPWTTWTSVTALLSTAGIPPLSGFWSKFLIIIALWQAGRKEYAALALMASVLTLAYFLIMQRKVFFGKTVPLTENAKEVSLGMLFPAVLLAGLMIGIGLYFPIIYTTLIEPLENVL